METALNHLSKTKIFPLVAKASQSLQTNSQEAEQHLEKLKDTVPKTIESLERTKGKLDEKKKRLENEGESIQREIGSLQQAQNSLRSSVNSLNVSKAGLQSSLDSANSDLSRAESDKERAERERKRAVDGTVASGFGALVLGILFPPSLAVTVPAVAAGGTISISNANNEIDRCRSRISSIGGSIAETERQISAANSEIATNQSHIADHDRRKQQLHEELGKVKESSVFMQKAESYFGQLKVAVEGGQNPTDLLHRFVETANQEEQYTILNSKGVQVIARSFAEAWEEVDEVMSNDQEGFMKITFVEVPHLK